MSLGQPVFRAAMPGHAVTASLAIVLNAVGGIFVLTAVARAAIVLRSEGRRTLLEPGSALMILIYLAGLFLLYAYAGHSLHPAS